MTANGSSAKALRDVRRAQSRRKAGGHLMSSVSLLRAPVVSSSVVMAWSVHDVVECQPAGRASVIVLGEARVGRVFRDGNRGIVVVKHFVLRGSAFGGLDNQRSPVFLKKLVTAALSVML